jgi:hypothetical protein
MFGALTAPGVAPYTRLRRGGWLRELTRAQVFVMGGTKPEYLGTISVIGDVREDPASGTVRVIDAPDSSLAALCRAHRPLLFTGPGLLLHGDLDQSGPPVP